MNKITVKDVYFDNLHANIEDHNKWIYVTSEIPIVPRRMVEMIISECNRRCNYAKTILNITSSEYYQGELYALDEITNYAESLLKQFEGDDSMCGADCLYKTDTCQEGLHCLRDCEE